MAVMSDLWIRKQSNKPTHYLCDEMGVYQPEPIRPPYTSKELNLISRWNHERRYEFIMGQPYAKPILSEEDISKYRVMIENMSQTSVRYIDRVTGFPFYGTEEEVTDRHRRIISYGVTSYGYDVRLKNDPDNIAVFTNILEPEINPKKITDRNFAKPVIHIDEEGGSYVLIPPHSYLQAPTIEYFDIPDDILVIVVGKSTYARAGLIVNCTPIEPGFKGEVVIEIANTTSSPVRCYLEEGIAQFVFLRGDEKCLTNYRDKAGKYQGQTGLTFAKV